MAKTPPEWTLAGFVEHFTFVHKKMPDHKFVWVLGAGASLASGIPLGSQLVDRWLQELRVREGGLDVPIEDWATAETLGIDGFTYSDRGSFYPRVYERRFREYPDEGYAYLEDVMSGKEPSPGYSILASSLVTTRHNAVITTNFDNLVADALSIYTDIFPFICGHESLTGFVRVAMRRPLVCKIHRDLLMGPQNEPRNLRRLHDSWGLALRALFEHYTPVFIGYGGNDDTLMDLLESLDPADIKGQMIWCFHEGGEPSDRIAKVVKDHRGYLVPAPDFDLLMVLLGERMGISLLDEEIGKRARARTQKYRKRIEELDVVRYPQVAKALAATMERSGGIWAYIRRSARIKDLDDREAFLRKGLHIFPKDPGVFNALGAFLADKRGAHRDAEGLFRKALEMRPDSQIYLGNLAECCLLQRKFAEARRCLDRAVGLDKGGEEVSLAIILGVLDRVEGKDDWKAITEARGAMDSEEQRRDWNFDPLLKFVKASLAADDAEFYWKFVAALKEPARLPEIDELLVQRYSGVDQTHVTKKSGRSARNTATRKRRAKNKTVSKKKATSTRQKKSKTKRTTKKR